MRLFIFSLCLLFGFVITPYSLSSQNYSDHIGDGNNLGVRISSSSFTQSNTPNQTINGTGYIPDLAGASRFLAQSSLGANYDDIVSVSEMGIEQWIEEQMNMSYITYSDKYDEIFQEIIPQLKQFVPDWPRSNFYWRRLSRYLSFAFYEKAIKEDDLLRQKAAFSLGQILVVSRAPGGMYFHGHSLASYYDILYKGAFGNFRDMIKQVSLSPTMGIYLSHFGNQKADLQKGTLPDENFARELMQLFTVGLYELNLDGTEKLDGQGNPIPTYDIKDVQEMAKIFTGLSVGRYDVDKHPTLANRPLEFELNFVTCNSAYPMAMYQEHHDTGPKKMVDGSVIPCCQSGMKDIEDAIDVLFNHPNVGPFIATRLIQQMVKSNPTPLFVKRIATVFNDNGQGVRGDLGAVFKAILLDPEARDCEWIDNNKTGKLKQPLERMLSFYKAFPMSSPTGKFWPADEFDLFINLEQGFMHSPSVFNFFTPFFQESKYVKPENMVSPEFQILNEITSTTYLNRIEKAIKNAPFVNFTNPISNIEMGGNPIADKVTIDFSDELIILQQQGIEALLDRFDLVFCHGQLTETSRANMLSALQNLDADPSISNTQILQMALYFIMVSPDYLILQ